MQTNANQVRLYGIMLAALLFTQAAYAFYNPSTGRWLNRDPIEERGGANLYAALANRLLDIVDPLGHIGYGWECLLCGPRCKDPCAEAKAKRIDYGHIGGNVCCGGRMFACVWSSGGISKATQPKAKEIIDGCSKLHEEQHVKQEPGCLGCGLYRPKPPIWRILPGECDAYFEQMKCLHTRRSQCSGDPACLAQVSAELIAVSDRAAKYCGLASK